MVENRFGVRIPRSVAPLGKYFTWVYGYAIQLEFGYEYSLRVELFMNCWKTLRLWEVLFDDPNGFTPVEGKKKYELFNDFIDLIRTESRTVQYRKRVSRANEKVAKRWRRSKLLVDALFEYRSSRLLVLRLDFGYRREIAKDITAAVAKADLDHFLNNRRGNPKLFRGWLSYIRKMEFAPQKGIHFHLIIFFNGVLRHKDAYLAQKIGEYWEKVTEMRGRYWNCNDSKHEYKRRGIGLIEHDDETKRNILLDDVVMYLAKTEQHVRSSILGSSVGNESDDHDETHKLFVLGAIPHKRRSVSGRPRRQPAAESFMG